VLKSKLSRNPLPVLLFTIFVDLIGFGIIIPIIPQLLANPASDFFLLKGGQSVDEGYIILGYLTAVYSIAMFVAAPILGQLSDRFGRKKILAVCLGGNAISYVIFAIGLLTQSLPILFISRIFAGLAGGSISVAQASIADFTSPDNRSKNFGLMGAAFGLGFIIGPYLGGKLSDPSFVSWFNPTTPFWFAAILAALNFISVLLIFPETNKHIQHGMKIAWNKSVVNIWHALNHPGLRDLFTVNFLFNAGFTFFTTFFAVFLINNYNFDQGEIGMYFAYVGVWFALTQAVIVRFLANKFTEVQIVRVALLLSGLSVFLYFFAETPLILYLITPIMAIANGLNFVNITALISKNADAKIQGEVLGISASVTALAQMIPPILSGYIAASLKPETPIYASAAVIFIAAGVFWFFFHPRKMQAKEAK
jgi:MFS transporter, DHA1 family, tetracycline resistance protein